MARARRIRGGVLAAGVSLLLASSGAGAQSLTSVRGLGYPLLPVDARSEIMGGLGIGLQGFNAPLTNPAAPAGLTRRGFVLSLANASRDMELGDASERTSATRFPLLQILFPVRGVVLNLGYGAMLDQAWGLTMSGSLPLADGGTLRFDDVMESTGGVGQFQVGAAVPIGEDIAVGASIGALTGNQRVQLVRRFDTAGDSRFQPFQTMFGWRYSGATASVGAKAMVGRVAQVGASVTWSGTVSADSTDGGAPDRSFELPIQVGGGASVYLASGLLAAASARWSGWSASAPAGAAGGVIGIGDVIGARDTWELGGGLELDDPASRAQRTFPLRVGVQYRQLPFTFIDDAPSEWFAGAGVGMRMGTDAENPIGLVDLAVQRGWRSAAGTEPDGDFRESVWRVSLSLSLFGN